MLLKMEPRHILTLTLVCASFVGLIAMPYKSSTEGTSQPQTRDVDDGVTALPSRSPSLQNNNANDNGKKDAPKYKDSDDEDGNDSDEDLKNNDNTIRAKVSKTMKEIMSTLSNPLPTIKPRLLSTLTTPPVTTTYPLFVSLPTFRHWISEENNNDGGNDNDDDNDDDDDDDDDENSFGHQATIPPRITHGDSLVTDEAQNIIVGEILEQMGKLSHTDNVPMWPAPPANREGVDLDPQRYRDYLNSLSREELRQLLSTLRKNVPPKLKVIDIAPTHRPSDVDDLKMSEVYMG